MEKSKLILPISIIIASIILGGVFYATQINKQESIERQQRVELDAKALQDETKQEQDHKEYVASRKTACFDIYNKEKDNWNNITGNEYVERTDTCYVIYKSQQGEWDGKICDDYLPGDKIVVGTELWYWSMQEYHDCTNKQFRKEF